MTVQSLSAACSSFLCYSNRELWSQKGKTGFFLCFYFPSQRSQIDQAACIFAHWPTQLSLGPQCAYLVSRYKEDLKGESKCGCHTSVQVQTNEFFATTDTNLSHISTYDRAHEAREPLRVLRGCRWEQRSEGSHSRAVSWETFTDSWTQLDPRSLGRCCKPFFQKKNQTKTNRKAHSITTIHPPTLPRPFLPTLFHPIHQLLTPPEHKSSQEEWQAKK